MDNLQKWLQDNQLDKYSEILLQNDITSIELLFELSEDDIKELGFSLGDRKRFTLAKKNILSQEDIELINSLPYVIAYPLKRALLEKNQWTKINLLKDTFLNYLKYLGLLSASEFFNSDIKDKGMVALFHKNLMETAFGKWNHYIRESLSFLKQKNHVFFYPELVDYYELVETGSKSKKYKGEIEYQDANGDTQLIVQTSITSIGMLINFRNRYLGHGQTLDEDKSQALWNEYYPIFKHLLEQLNFTKDYPMLKREDGETYLLHTAEIKTIETLSKTNSNIWIENKEGQTFDILPFFIVPGEVSLAKEDKEQLLTYESYTGKTIKFFSPEGTEKQTSGKILEKLNLLLRDKQKETPFTPEAFTKEEFLKRIAEENKLLIDTLNAEKKIIPGVYQHREEIELKLREWIGARASIFFITAEAGSGKTNLLVEIQKQYTERELPSLLIRAGRMEKQTLKQQIAYLLNLDLSNGLENYTSSIGTQAHPTFILIDGLNESNTAEDIWQEIIELSKLFKPGSLKFVVTNRASTKVDLERYIVSDSENDLFYGENKDNEKGLSAYTYWLTALDMKEMNGAWENYGAKDKSLYKPLFSFDDIAIFDRALYNQINNPLILRLFLEIYNGKHLPKKGNKHLHVWQDWFKTFNSEEQIFLKLLADEIWLIGNNELLLDDLLKHEKLKPYLTSDIISGPYNRLKNSGWISRYVKDLNGFIGLTVEGALFYLLGIKLTNQDPEVSIEFIHTILKNENKLQKAAIESFLCEKALDGDLDLLTNLIDAGNEDIDLSITPLLFYLKTFGVNATIEKVLEKPTDNDWKVLLKLNNKLNELQLFTIKIELSNCIYSESIKKDLKIPNETLINILPEFSYPQNEKLISEIENNIETGNFENDEIIRLKKDLVFYCSMNRFPDKAELLMKDIYANEDIKDPNELNSIGAIYNSIGNEKEAIKYYHFAKENLLKYDKNNSKLLAQVYFNIAGYEEQALDKMRYYQNALELESSIYGVQHEDTARTISVIGRTYIQLKQYDLAFIKLNEAFAIFNNIGADLEEIYTSFGYYYENIDDFNNAVEYYNKALELHILKVGESSTIISLLAKVASNLNRIGDNDKVFEFFEKANLIINNTNSKDTDSICYIKGQLGWLNFNAENYDVAINYFSEVLPIFLKFPSEFTTSRINTIYYYFAYSYYCLNDFDNAITILNNIIHLKPDEIKTENYIEYNELMGHCYFNLLNYDDAIVFYKKTIDFYEDIPAKCENFKLIASCFEKLNKFEDAVDYYNYCLELVNEGEFELDLSLVYFRLGVCFQNLTEYDKAIGYFLIGSEIDSEDYFYLERIAKCYELAGNKQKSLEYFIKVAELRQSDIKFGISDESTKDSILNAKRIAKDLGVENDLPDWMKKINS